jgi:hypothetical protein
MLSASLVERERERERVERHGSEFMIDDRQINPGWNGLMSSNWMAIDREKQL